MKKKLKKLLTMILTLAITLTIVPTFALPVKAVNITGDGFRYYIESDGEASIYGYDGTSTDIVIPYNIDGHTVTAIHAMNNSGNVKSITIPSSVITIYDTAFSFCDSLESITYPYTSDRFYSIDGVLYHYVYDNEGKQDRLLCYPPAKKDKNFEIDGRVKYISNGAFVNCKFLESITVNNTWAVPPYYFSSLDGVLYNVDKTEIIRYPQGKTDTSFTIPSSVTSVRDYAFNNCDTLKNINYLGTPTQFNEIDVGYNNAPFGNATIHLLYGTMGSEEFGFTFDASNNPILPLGYTDSLNKHFAILGWKDKNGNKVDVSTLTVDNMIPLTAVIAEIPVAPALLEADLIPNKDPYLPTGNKYINGFYVQGTQIRVPSFDGSVKMGLRFVNILDNNLLTGLKDGATDISYGTLVVAKKKHNGGEVTLDTKNATKVEGKKTFKHASEFNDQYLKFTVCVTGIKEENFTENIIVRPYITFTFNGNVVTLYGEQYENASLYSAAKLAVAEGSTENPSVQTWLQANIIDIVEQTGDNEVEL